jgi:hypothetical protein
MGPNCHIGGGRSKKNGYLYELMRPEFLKKNPKPLSSGACPIRVSHFAHYFPVSHLARLVPCWSCGIVCAVMCVCGGACSVIRARLQMLSRRSELTRRRSTMRRSGKPPTGSSRYECRESLSRGQWRANGDSSARASGGDPQIRGLSGPALPERRGPLPAPVASHPQGGHQRSLPGTLNFYN